MCSRMLFLSIAVGVLTCLVSVRPDSDKRPNILVIQADQISAKVLGFCGGQRLSAKTPNLDKLAARSTVFSNMHTSNPLCTPARMAMMTGKLTSRTGAYDNGADISSRTPTFAHYLRSLGYRTALAGKMHFVGGDQLHGFEERLTTDIYASDFGWYPSWSEPKDRRSWAHNMNSVVESGPKNRTLQIDFDEETGYQSVRWLYDVARDQRDADPRPFLLFTSFTHPHDPYLSMPRFFDSYTDADIPPVQVPFDESRNDHHSQRVRASVGMDEFNMTDEDVTRSRRAYYGSISYVDEWVGKLLQALDDAGVADSTAILFTGDHGDMLGERGLWYKMQFYEYSIKIPLLVSLPGQSARLESGANVALTDLLPTLVSLAGGDTSAIVAPMDGRDLTPLLGGGKLPEGWDDVAFAEYMGEGSISPMFMIKRGNLKYFYSKMDGSALYDIEADPLELNNLANSEDPVHRSLTQRFDEERLAKWDEAAIDADVRKSQEERALVFGSLMRGKYTPWDFVPQLGAKEADRYTRNHRSLMSVDVDARIPYKKPLDPHFEAERPIQPVVGLDTHHKDFRF